MFGFAVDTGLRPDNPFVDVKNRDRQHARDRVLSMTELAAIWRAARQMAYPWGPFIKLILLTGDRRAEWARARWDWLSNDWSLLTIPAAFYKTGKDQVVPISDAARVILALLPREITGPHIFSTDGGATPISGFSKAKARLDALLAEQCGNPMAPWVIHDLRRSMATHMERLGIEPHVIEMCLGHVLKGVEGTYRRYAYLPEKTVALQAWADELARACGEPDGCPNKPDCGATP
jgi:integrase